ncbi:MFS general substrate transporter [Hyaloscypha variabilis F]|uniref:MFS general substrate transporter n=1 Tax=Hyaloscypha variabilis (strain UAMH 11265 / GT02V1 / F) TaxID=1149755 RepID=A0A2J6SE95_HYAVF|nr:MFS general substrate transporter [Hyaloscypha variabilis F]
MASTSNDIALRRLSQPDDGSSAAVELRPVTRQKQILVLNSGFLTICIVVGFNQAYGVFQGYYTSKSQTILPPSASSSGALLAFVGTLGSGLTWGGSIFVNPLLSRVEGKTFLHLSGRKWITITGVLLMSTGFLLASFATQIYHLLLTQGLLYGLGSSMLYFPILSTAPEYFTSHRGSALGFILSGTGVGGLILSPTIQALLTHLGPRSTLRLLALLTLILALPIAVTAAPSRFVQRRQTHIDISTALTPSFLFSAAAAFLSASGNLLPAIFLPQFSVAIGYTSSFAAILLALSNAVSCCSQTLVGFLGDRVGRQNTLLLMIVLSTIGTLGLWMSAVIGGEKRVWIVFVVLYGVAGGGFNALFPTMVGEVFGMRSLRFCDGSKKNCGGEEWDWVMEWSVRILEET